MQGPFLGVWKVTRTPVALHNWITQKIPNNLVLAAIVIHHSIINTINTSDYIGKWGFKGHLGLKPVPCHSQPLSDKPFHKLINGSILGQIRPLSTVNPTEKLFKSFTSLLLCNILLIFSLSLFTDSSYSFVLLATLSFRLNSFPFSLVVFLGVFIDNIHIPSELWFYWTEKTSFFHLVRQTLCWRDHPHRSSYLNLIHLYMCGDKYK